MRVAAIVVATTSLVVASAALLFPPFSIQRSDWQFGNWFGFILSGPANCEFDEATCGSATINVPLLALELLAITVIGAAGTAIASTFPNNRDSTQKAKAAAFESALDIVSKGTEAPRRFELSLKRTDRANRVRWLLELLAILAAMMTADFFLRISFGNSTEAVRGGMGTVGAIVGLLIWFWQLDLNVRRLHDIGASGWWVILPWACAGAFAISYASGFGGVVGSIVGVMVLAYVAALFGWPGTPGENKYGVPPGFKEKRS